MFRPLRRKRRGISDEAARDLLESGRRGGGGGGGEGGGR